MCLMQYIHEVTVQITEQLSRQMYSKHCQTFKMVSFAKRTMHECRCATRNISGQVNGESVELWYFNKHFVKNTRNRSRTEKHFGNFCPRNILNSYILNGKFNPKMDTIRAFLFKIRTPFSFSSPLPPCCASVSVAEYVSISLNMSILLNA